MLQRFQSIALLLAAAATFLSLKFSFYTGFDKDIKPASLTAVSSLVILIMTIFTGAIALITIFLFKNRNLQFLLCLAGMLLQSWVIFLYFNKAATFQSGTYSLSSLLQPLIMVFFFLAARGVRKDMKTIKDSERLR